MTPGHVATGKVTKEGDMRVYSVTLSSAGWNRDTRLRPAWLQIQAGAACWPDLPRPEPRLNLGTVQGDHFGCILR